MSQIFDIVEELEKERKKNKTLEYKVQELNAVIEYQKNKLKEYKNIKEKLVHAETTAYNKNKIISKMQKNIINKAIDYIEKYCIDGVENEYNTPQTVFEEDGIEKDNARIELLNILKGDNK